MIIIILLHTLMYGLCQTCAGVPECWEPDSGHSPGVGTVLLCLESAASCVWDNTVLSTAQHWGHWPWPHWQHCPHTVQHHENGPVPLIGKDMMSHFPVMSVSWYPNIAWPSCSFGLVFIWLHPPVTELILWGNSKNIKVQKILTKVL